MHDNLYLIGFMGCGKSTIARILAKIYSCERIEMDEAIEQEQNMTIREIFEKYGEEYFRDAESRWIREIARKKPVVVSCGGGAVLRPENVSAMKNSGRILLLTAEPQTILERVRHSDNRPLLNGHMNVEDISALMEKRRPAYEAAADHIISTDDKKPGRIAEEIYQLMHNSPL